MLMPKKVKWRKQSRGRMRGQTKGGALVSFGEYGLKALEPGWVCLETKIGTPCKGGWLSHPIFVLTNLYIPPRRQRHQHLEVLAVSFFCAVCRNLFH